MLFSCILADLLGVDVDLPAVFGEPLSVIVLTASVDVRVLHLP